MCAKDCDVPTPRRGEKLKVTEETCNFSKKGDKEVNNPKKFCKCMVKGCGGGDFWKVY